MKSFIAHDTAGKAYFFQCPQRYSVAVVSSEAQQVLQLEDDATVAQVFRDHWAASDHPDACIVPVYEVEIGQTAPSIEMGDIDWYAQVLDNDTMAGVTRRTKQGVIDAIAAGALDKR